MSRIEEIEARANDPFGPDNTRAQMDSDRDYLLAELRKRDEALKQIGKAADANMSRAYKIRALVTAASGGQ